MKFLAAFIATLAVGAQAKPIVFATAQFDTATYAVAGAVADAHSDANPPSSLPLATSATAIDTNDFATSFAVASPGLLLASAEADSSPGAIGANAGAQTHFLGTFLGTGALDLHMGLDLLNSLTGSGAADATLFVLLTNTLGSTTTTLFNDLYTTTGDINLHFTALGGLSTLDLVLFSEASTTGAGQSGQNFAQVTFDGTIPSPATPLLVMTGLGAIVLTTRRKRVAV